MRQLLRRLWYAIRQRRYESDLAEEIDLHRAMKQRELEADGLSASAAATQTRRELGNLTLAREESLGVWIWSWFESVWQDVRYGVRSLRRNPGFAIVAVFTLAIGIGATTAIFSVVNALLLRPLPYPDADRIVRLVMNAPAAESPTGHPLRTSLGLSGAELREVQSQVRALDAVGAASSLLVGLSGAEEAARLQAARVSHTVFPMLEARPFLGRVFRPDDEVPGAAPVILLSYSLWQRSFGGDPAVIGRTVILDSALGRRAQYRYTVVGVMPPMFAYPIPVPQLWIPATAASRNPLVGRLKNGVSIEAATADVQAVLRAVRPQAPQTRYELVREQDDLVGSVKPALLVLTVAVGFVLVIACVNVASLLLARSAARQREMAIRTAIGAHRSRLLRQTLTESLVLTLVGAAGGLGVAFSGVRVLRVLAATVSRVDLAMAVPIPRLDEIVVDGRVALFAVAISLITGLAFGLAPALGASRADGASLLRGHEGTQRGVRRRLTSRQTLVIIEIAAATVLLIGGTLLVRSINLSTVMTGYDPTGVLTFQVSLPLDRYPDSRLRTFSDDLVTHLRAIPGVASTAYANQIPTVNLSDSAGGLWTTPDPARAPVASPDARFVSQDYFQALGIRIVAGRGFGPEDRAGQPRVVLINQVLAERMFAGLNPIGTPVFVGRDVTPWQIVGIVENVRQFGLDHEAEPQFFADLRQWAGAGPLFPAGAYYAIRTDHDPQGLIGAVRTIVRQLDPQAALFNVAPMTQLVSANVARPRLYAVLVALFAAVGLILALVGIYGVVAYVVSQRTRELGIRRALGAQRADVLTLILGQILVLTVAAIVLGMAGAAALSRSLEGMLFGLTPLDGRTFLGVGVLFSAVVVLAAYVPAQRATKVDPLVALRCE